ncbi:MAG: hypothetical protein FWE35_26730 [Streptosporangiales bacterium]|nr:hypothetical protein [Streptosporangiales bacterium]
MTVAEEQDRRFRHGDPRVGGQHGQVLGGFGDRAVKAAGQPASRLIYQGMLVRGAHSAVVPR